MELGLFDPAGWRETLDGVEALEGLRGEMVLDAPSRNARSGYSLRRLRGTAGLLLLFQDLTEMKKLEEEARSREKLAAVGQLAAGIAHEIRNPLASISGSAQLLATEMRSGSSERRLVEIMRVGIATAIRTSWRTFCATPGRGRDASKRSTSRRRSPRRWISSPTATRSPTSTASHSRSCPRIRASPAIADQIRQIFWNVARNAVAAMPAEATLTVTGRDERGWYTIRFPRHRARNDARRARDSCSSRSRRRFRRRDRPRDGDREASGR